MRPRGQPPPPFPGNSAQSHGVGSPDTDTPLKRLSVPLGGAFLSVPPAPSLLLGVMGSEEERKGRRGKREGARVG